jgi:hypothetical protein
MKTHTLVGTILAIYTGLVFSGCGHEKAPKTWETLYILNPKQITQEEHPDPKTTLLPLTLCSAVASAIWQEGKQWPIEVSVGGQSPYCSIAVDSNNDGFFDSVKKRDYAVGSHTRIGDMEKYLLTVRDSIMTNPKADAITVPY